MGGEFVGRPTAGDTGDAQLLGVLESGDCQADGAGGVAGDLDQIRDGRVALAGLAVVTIRQSPKHELLRRRDVGEFRPLDHF